MVAVRLTTGQRIRVADSWATATTDTFQRIISLWQPELDIKERSTLKLFNIMVGLDISPEEEDDIDLAAAIWECTRFVYEENMNLTKLPVPKFISISGVKIEIPKDLGRLKIGQNIHARQELAAVNDSNAAMSIIVAIYLQPLIDKSAFDFHRAKQIELQILQMPITQIYPIGFFLLNRLRNYGKGLLPNLSRMIRMIMQDVRLLLNWRKVKDLLRSLD